MRSAVKKVFLTNDENAPAPSEWELFCVYKGIYMGIYKGYGKLIFDFEFGTYSSPCMWARFKL